MIRQSPWKQTSPAGRTASVAGACWVLAALPIGCNEANPLRSEHVEYAIVDLGRSFDFENPTRIVIESNDDFDAFWNLPSTSSAEVPKPELDFRSSTGVFVSSGTVEYDSEIYAQRLRTLDDGSLVAGFVLHTDRSSVGPAMSTSQSVFIVIPENVKVVVHYDVFRGKTQNDHARATVSSYRVTEFIEDSIRQKAMDRETACSELCK